MKQSVVSIILLIIIIAGAAYLIMKSRKYKTEKEKNAIDKGLIAYLLTNNFLNPPYIYNLHY